jgi:hypothetical protein
MITIVGAILIASVAFSIYSQNQINQVPIEYSYDIATEDFYIKDINFVSYHDSLYVAGNYYLEMIGENKQFDGVSFGCSIDGTHYKVDGESKQVIGEIKLSNVIKPSITKGSREPIRL